MLDKHQFEVKTVKKKQKVQAKRISKFRDVHGVFQEHSK